MGSRSLSTTTSMSSGLLGPALTVGLGRFPESSSVAWRPASLLASRGLSRASGFRGLVHPKFAQSPQLLSLGWPCSSGPNAILFLQRILYSLHTIDWSNSLRDACISAEDLYLQGPTVSRSSANGPLPWHKASWTPWVDITTGFDHRLQAHKHLETLNHGPAWLGLDLRAPSRCLLQWPGVLQHLGY